MSAGSMPLWRDDNSDIFHATVARAAQDLGIPALAVEKDYWVCEALRAVETAHPRVTVFKGGTSLQKMGIIARFSEDLDLMVTGTIGGGKAGPRFLKELCEAAREVLHDLNLVARYCDQLIAMKNGQIHSAGGPGLVVNRQMVQEVFGIDSHIVTDPVSGAPLVIPIGKHRAHD